MKRPIALLFCLLMITIPLTGCIEEESGTSNENLDSNNGEIILDSTNYLGFMDNSSIYGWLIDPIENFSRIYITQSENNCTTTEYGDDWNGVWTAPLCVKDLSNYGNLTHENEELCIEGNGESVCWNMTVSNRVMWLQGDIWGGQEDMCSVYIQSEAFTPSSNYNLTLRTYDDNGDYINVDWSDLWSDSAYSVWEQERMDTYNSELASIPAWCTEPVFDWVHWASS